VLKGVGKNNDFPFIEVALNTSKCDVVLERLHTGVIEQGKKGG
jgi:hypothetical protein